MECELNGARIKYEDGKLWLWKEKWCGKMLKVPNWYEMKGRKDPNGRVDLCIGGRTTNGGRHFKYHRVVYYIHNQEWNIWDISKSNIIDHIDRNPSNNNIENLRVVSHQQNMWNQDRKGYGFHKLSGKWRARIVIDRKEKYLGLFTSEDDARVAYLNAKEKYHSF